MVRHSLWLCVSLALVAIALVAISIGWQPWGFISSPISSAVAAPNFWDGYMPLAQFTAAASLAYLALEMFRHSGQIEEAARLFFGSTVVDRKSVLDTIAGADLETLKKNRAELALIIRVYELNECRHKWPRVDSAKKKQLSKRIQVIQGMPDYKWFQTKAGRLYISHFLVGKDFLWVGTGLFMSVWIHLMASAENAVQLYHPSFMSHWFPQLVLTGILAWFGVIIPLWNAFDGRHVMEDFREFQDIAKEQLDSLRLELRKKDLDDMKTILENLLSSTPGPPDPAVTKKPPSKNAPSKKKAQSKTAQPSKTGVARAATKSGSTGREAGAKRPTAKKPG